MLVVSDQRPPLFSVRLQGFNFRRFKMLYEPVLATATTVGVVEASENATRYDLCIRGSVYRSLCRDEELRMIAR